ncbi:hypothetical protein HK404_21140 [Myxococcus xanthus]|nr:hypothetical protein [Myxococcus xanthus]
MNQLARQHAHAAFQRRWYPQVWQMRVEVERLYAHKKPRRVEVGSHIERRGSTIGRGRRAEPVAILHGEAQFREQGSRHTTEPLLRRDKAVTVVQELDLSRRLLWRRPYVMMRTDDERRARAHQEPPNRGHLVRIDRLLRHQMVETHNDNGVCTTEQPVIQGTAAPFCALTLHERYGVAGGLENDLDEPLKIKENDVLKKTCDALPIALSICRPLIVRPDGTPQLKKRWIAVFQSTQRRLLFEHATPCKVQ